MKTTYTYTVLRYVHDPSTGEFVNVGAALYAPEARFVGVLGRTTYERFSCMFPDFDGNAFRSVMRFVTSRFHALNENLQADSLFDERPKSIMELACAVLPHDDASFRWSEPAGGITDDPAGALQKIYARMVSRYDEKAESGGRNEEDIRNSLGQEFQKRGVSRYLTPKTITAPHEEMSFPYAHKNGVWGCLDGISLDLTQPESIRNKARRWLGLALALSKSTEAFKLYLLLAEPRHPDAQQRKAVRRAIDLLEEMPVEHRIVRESEAGQFADDFSEEVRAHESK
jgi:hypothetical protein